VLLSCVACLGDAPIKGFRPPAVPLIANDPYFSIWSSTTLLTDSWPMLWDGTIKAFTGMIRIDGTSYRFMGPGDNSGGSNANPIAQTSLNVYPTRTVYEFQGAGVTLALTFTTPAITTDLDLLSRPITFLTYSVTATDGKAHNVQVYYDNTAEIAVNQVTETVVASRNNSLGLSVMRIGTKAQNVVGQSGDGIGINWGYFYVASKTGSNVQQYMGPVQAARDGFVANGKIPADANVFPEPANQNWPGLAIVFDLGSVGSQSVENFLVLAYDDIISMNYFGDLMAPYWKQKFPSAEELISASYQSYATIYSQCSAFDTSALAKLSAVGGDQYATIAALAYRQTTAGAKLVWNAKKKTVWYFMKEISSDGDVSTVDVIFPASPFLLYFNPDLLDLLFIPIMEYANNATNHPYGLEWAPHHLGQWPIANIQTNQQENMPIEETGNMLCMMAAVVQKTGNLNTVKQYWTLVQKWGNYLIANLPDPGNQLCTDDFEGPTPHDSNLAVKGIVAIGAAGFLAEKMGDSTLAQKFSTTAANYAKSWMKLANPTGGNHYRLRYDQDGWSLKYNLLFQYVLGLDIFPQSVLVQETAYYMSMLHPYGVPLDNRSDFTKLDWLSWMAAMAPNASDSDRMISAIYKFADETPDRVPLSDWYYTTSGKKSGFQARTVVGGFYAKALLSKK